MSIKKISVPKEETKFIGTPINWFAIRIINGMKTIEKRRENVKRSMPSISVLLGKKAKVRK